MQQDERLNGVETRGEADPLVMVLPRLAVLAEGRHALRQRLVVGHEGARVAHRPEILARVEAERASRARRARGEAVAPGPMGLAGILDHGQIVPRGEVGQPAHVDHLPVEMDGKDRPRAAGQRRLHRREIDPVVRLGDVDEDRLQARLHDRFGRGDERHRREHDLRPRFEVQGHEPEAESVGAARDADAPRRPAGVRERRSKSAIAGPLANALESMRSANEAIIRSRSGSCDGERSRNGTFPTWGLADCWVVTWETSSGLQNHDG